jgi:hypothetical protein
MTIEEILPYVEIVSFLIAILVIVYEFGKWRERNAADKEDLNRRLDALSAKIDKVPQEFLPVFIDLYKMWEKLGEKPEARKKERTQND